MDWILTFVAASWAVFGAMAPYLLLGFVVAGLLSVVISPEFVERHLGGRGIWPVIKASAFGVPLPLCSCGVIPVAASLRRHGASKGATTAFLISTPQTGVDSIMVTFSLLGPVYAVFRPVVALISGVFGGAVVTASERDTLLASPTKTIFRSSGLSNRSWMVCRSARAWQGWAKSLSALMTGTDE